METNYLQLKEVSKKKKENQGISNGPGNMAIESSSRTERVHARFVRSKV